LAFAGHNISLCGYGATVRLKYTILKKKKVFAAILRNKTVQRGDCFTCNVHVKGWHRRQWLYISYFGYLY